MSFGRFVVLMTIATLLAWAGWFYVLLKMDPAAAGAIVPFIFYTTLGIAVFGTVCLIGLFVRKTRQKQLVVAKLVSRSVRHGVFLSLLLIGALVLSTKDLLRLWTVLPLVIFTVLLELLFLSVQDAPKQSIDE